MKWKFWSAKQQIPEQIQLDNIQERLSVMVEQSAANAKHLAYVAEKVIAGNEQTNKWSRFQYKSVQESQSRFEQMGQMLESIKQWQDDQDLNSAHIDMLENSLDQVSLTLIRWLDDIDHLCMALPEGNDGWVEMLRQWRDQLLDALVKLDINELDILHRPFDPSLAESIGTAERNPTEAESIGTAEGDPTDAESIKVPFQVVNVIKRGFTRGQHMILRKAQVITLQYDGGES